MTFDSEVLAGLLFLFFGVVAVILGWGYGLGNLTQLGSGAMPVLAGTALCVLGAAQLMRAMRAARTNERHVAAFSRSELRPLLLILGAVSSFAVLIIPMGLILALAALIAISWFAQKGGRKWEIARVMVTVVFVIIAIFKYALGLPLRLFAWGF